MRLHHLRITAFGPFADPVEVDFDALGDAGLFLLTGPTGAGKSSVLDAICFALYSAVPGDRNGAKHLHSDLAAPGVAPEVTLELTLAGRRLRVVRSPAWLRPRKRGTGTTRQQAGVVVTEQRAGSWQPVTNRIDEAGDLLSGLIGLTMSQFCQVSMLPQGQFQAFLRAGPDERRALLARLFRTSRFDQVESYLRDRRVVLRRESATQQAAVAEAVARLAEAAGTERPVEWDNQDLEEPAETGALTEWSRSLADRAEEILDVARAEETRTRVRAAAAEESHARAVRMAALRQRHADATARLQALTAAQPDVDGQRAALVAADRARSVGPAAELADRSRAEHEHSLQQLDRARAALGPVTAAADADAAACERRVEAAIRRAARLDAVRPRAERREQVVSLLAAAGARRAEAAAESGQIATDLAGLPAGVSTARIRLAEAEAAATRLPAVTDDVARARRQLAAARTVQESTTALAEAQALLVRTQEQVVTAGETLIALRERRLAGMAAEMAGDLAAGCACPVCGSAEHPSPAARSGAGPDAATEKAAQSALDDAKAELTARDSAARDLRTVLDAATATSQGRSLTDLDHQLTVAETDLAVTTEAAQRVAASRLALADIETRAAELTAAQAAATTRLAELAATIDGHTREAAAIDHELSEVLDGDVPEDRGAAGDDRLHGRVDRDETVDLATRLTSAAARCRTAAAHWRDLGSAITAEGTARDRARVARATAEQAAADAGFDGLPQALAGLLTDDQLTRLRELIGDHEARLAATRETLADPEVLAAVEATTISLDDAVAERERTAQALRGAHAATTAAAARATRLHALDADLATALGRWAPVRDRWHQVADLASLVEGKHPDNRWQMRLSAYVLTHRLGQVVDAANERLSAMSDGRYQLEHTGRRGAGETRGGLSLVVRDDWSGESRDPSTLSGGETFVVSLALALGLADVITHEAGGAALDTLFVDEGFGSLDADTLDDVLGTLDSLRAGGRVVGVISHVAEMADRIPAQLRVAKGRAGSTLTTAT